jgi:hypothetical protein
VIVAPIPFEIVAEDYSEADTPRSTGLHLGQIISAIDKSIHGKRYPDTDNQTRQGYFSMGFMWERFLSEVFRDTAVKKSDGVLVRPGELYLSGIAMSPDAIDLSDYALEEYKATYVSSSHEIDDTSYFWHWHVQMKCYCKALATLTARLRVWFIVGDWKGSGPQIRAYQFQFTQQEVDDAFQMCVNHARAEGWL